MNIRKSLFGYEGQGLPLSVLKGWWQALEKYSSDPEIDEAPWAFNERASISMLAAGCWLAGGVALEEYSTDKNHPDRRVKAGRTGRGDLFLRVGSKEFACEAKPHDLPLPMPGKSLSVESFASLKADYLKSVGDASLVYSDDGKPTALLFVSVYHEGEKLGRNGRVGVDALLSELKAKRKILGASQMAWYFRKDWIGKPNSESARGLPLREMGTVLFVGNPKKHR